MPLPSFSASLLLDDGKAAARFVVENNKDHKLRRISAAMTTIRTVSCHRQPPMQRSDADSTRPRPARTESAAIASPHRQKHVFTRTQKHGTQHVSNVWPLTILALLSLHCLSSLPFAHAACDASTYYDNDGCNDVVANSAASPYADFGIPSWVTLITYSLLSTIVGWIALLYPFYYVPKFESKVRGYVELGHVCRGTIVSMRRGRVFNPLRWCSPSRHNCYVTVTFGGSGSEKISGSGSGRDSASPPGLTSVDSNVSTDINVPCTGRPSSITPSITPSGARNESSAPNSTHTLPFASTTLAMGPIRKELVIEEPALQLLLDRSSSTIDIYTAGPSYPLSGMLNDQYQGQRVTLPAKVAYGIGSTVLLGVAFYLSFGVTSSHLFTPSPNWKFWLVLAGHAGTLLIAYGCCHFLYRKRVEALLYGTIDDGTAAYGRCGIASLEGGGGGGGGGDGRGGVEGRQGMAVEMALSSALGANVEEQQAYHAMA